MGHAGVIIESALVWTVSERWGVFFSKVSGKIFPEIFEKSIDKHEIDAILKSPSSFHAAFL